MNKPRWCYYVVEGQLNQHKNGPLIAIVEEDKSTYTATNHDWGGKATAQMRVDKENYLLGLQQKDVDEIVARSMFGPQVKL